MALLVCPNVAVELTIDCVVAIRHLTVDAEATTTKGRVVSDVIWLVDWRDHATAVETIRAEPARQRAGHNGRKAWLEALT